MTIRNVVFVLVCQLLMSMVSCTLEKEAGSSVSAFGFQTKPTANERQISHVTYGTDPDAEKGFAYDNSGQLIKAGAYIDTIYFTYKSDSIIKYYADKNTHWNASVRYALDQNGRVVTSSIRDADSNEISNYRFIYDSSGYMVRTIQHVASTGYNFVNQFTYAAGNLEEITSYDADGKVESRYLYEYHPDKKNDINLFLHSITDDYFTHERLGRKNADLIKSLTNVTENGDTLSHVTYQYIDEMSNTRLTAIETDVLNENTTEIHYHFVKRN